MHIIESTKVGQRLPVLLAIAAVHAALIALMGPLSPMRSAAADPAVEVTFTEEKRTPPPEQPPIAPTLIALTPLPLLEPPVVELAEDPARINAITVLPTDKPPIATAAGRTVSIDDLGYVRAPRPRYPAESRRLAEQGLVLLLVTIDESGRVARVQVQASSGHPRLDAAARDAVEQALFKPYLENGVARTVIATIPIEFSWKRRGAS